MPILKSDFNPTTPLFKNGHFNTIYRALFFKGDVTYTRKRIKTWDDDFIDLDFSIMGSKNLVVHIHGLEGSSQSNYMTASAKHLNNLGYDTVCFNLRGCSGEDNLLLNSYHSGKTEDLDFVLNYLLDKYNYQKIALVGYSLGGNLTLKYFGENNSILNSKIHCAVTVSVPVDLASSSRVLSKFENTLYMQNFLKTLKSKIISKVEKHKSLEVDLQQLKKAKNFKDLDDLYTAPVNGFKDAEDYWEKASSKPFLKNIIKPVLLITSEDDPFLSPECIPFEEALSSDSFFLEATKYGGHVGFLSSFNKNNNHWLENRIANFLQNYLH